MDKAQGQQRAAETRAIRAEEELSQARQAQAASHDKQIQLEHNLAQQVHLPLHQLFEVSELVDGDLHSMHTSGAETDHTYK